MACRLSSFEDTYFFYRDATEPGTGRELFLTVVSATSKNLEWCSLIIMGDGVASSDDPGKFPQSAFVSTGSSLINPWRSHTELVIHTALMSHDRQPESLKWMFFHGSMMIEFVLCRYIRVMSLWPAKARH